MRIIYLILSIVLLFSCSVSENNNDTKKIRVVSTTTMITDLVSVIGADKIELTGLMGAGVDPHLYKASENDVNTLFNADIVFYNGLHLEGKLEDVLKKMNQRGVAVVAVSDAIDKSELIASSEFESNYDPHIWFNIDLWKQAAVMVAETLAAEDTSHAKLYRTNLQSYMEKLTELEVFVVKQIDSIPVEKRVLITAHDAFNYFGKKFNFEVLGLQGLSTATEAGVKDVQNLSQIILDKQVKAVFVETSVSKRSVEALQEAVKAKGYAVALGGELYSDALGSANTNEGTYIGMYKHNVETIVTALK